MFKYFIDLEFKEFFRSGRFAKRIGLKVLVFIAYLYFGAVAIFLGVGAYLGVKEELPEENTFLFGNKYLLYFFFAFLVLNLLLSPSPSMKVRPLMILPIKKRKIINYFLLKLQLSYLSLFSFTLLISYTVVLLKNESGTVGVIAWFLSVSSILLSLSLIAFIGEKSYKVIAAVIFALAVVVGLKYYDVVDVPEISGRVFYSIYENPLLCVVYIGMFFFVYFSTYKLMKSRFYTDGALKSKAAKVYEMNLSWLDRFGTIAVFLKNDIRMILRNKRPRNAALFSLYFILYGFWIFGMRNGELYETKNMFRMLFSSMIMTGGFLFSFGNLVPAWDSENYRLFMSQNIKYSQYLDSKWWLMVASVVVLSFLSLPFIYYGVKAYFLILAMAVFNIGFNTYLVLIGGLFNDNPIRLNEKVRAFQNSGGFNINSFLLGLLRLILPILIYYLAHRFFNDTVGLLALVFVGLAGVIFKSGIMKFIEKLYAKKKYALIESFSKEE